MDEQAQTGMLDKIVSALRGVGQSGVEADSGLIAARQRYTMYRAEGGTLPFEQWIAQGEPAP